MAARTATNADDVAVPAKADLVSLLPTDAPTALPEVRFPAFSHLWGMAAHLWDCQCMRVYGIGRWPGPRCF